MRTRNNNNIHWLLARFMPDQRKFIAESYDLITTISKESSREKPMESTTGQSVK